MLTEKIKNTFRGCFVWESIKIEKSSIKICICIIGIIISAASIVYVNLLINKLKEREEKWINLYAKTLEYVSNEKEYSQNFTFILQEIIIPNNYIPVILTDEHKIALEYRNIYQLEKITSEREKKNILQRRIENMEQQYKPIKILVVKGKLNQPPQYNYIYYENSYLLKELQYFPYIQIIIILIFGLIMYAGFLYLKKIEENNTWIGLAKETAHQLGTPLSSLIGWLEHLKNDEQFKNSAFVEELEKDIDKLQTITERFSQIGSPVNNFQQENIVNITKEVLEYIEKRIPTDIHLELVTIPTKSLDISALVNKPLYSWVIENVCKNAVESLSGKGFVSIKIIKANHNQVFIEIRDTGRGLMKNEFEKVFEPGYTKKKRGWGLGLTLCKRIIEQYHRGKIFVKESELGKGTTFKIILSEN